MATSAEHVIACTLKPSFGEEQDYFSIFGLEPGCDVDLDDLRVRYRQLQQAVHPDRFVHECDRSQRLAQQQAAQVNAAYNTLQSPLLRAQYLMACAGQSRPSERTVQDSAFLLTQIDLRERLDEAVGNMDALDDLMTDVRQRIVLHQQAFADAWQKRDWVSAQNAIDRLQFATKLSQEIEDRQEHLLDV